MKIDMKIAARLKAARKTAGYRSAFEFSQAFNIPKTTYTQHENGSRIPKDSALGEYADYLKVNLGWLKFGRGLPYGSANDEQTDALKKEIGRINETLSVEHICEIPPLNDNLLAMILESLLDYTQAQGKILTNKEISKAVAGLYASLSADIQTTDHLTIDIINAAIKTYSHFTKISS